MGAHVIREVLLQAGSSRFTIRDHEGDMIYVSDAPDVRRFTITASVSGGTSIQVVVNQTDLVELVNSLHDAGFLPTAKPVPLLPDDGLPPL